MQYLTLAITLGFIKNVESFEYLTNELLRRYMDEEVKEWKTIVTIERLNALIEKELDVDIGIENARSRLQGLLVHYYALLANQRLTWIVKDTQKLAVSPVLSAIKPGSLSERIELVLPFVHDELRKNFSKFPSHVVKLSEAF